MTNRTETITFGDFIAPAGTVVAGTLVTFDSAEGAHQEVKLAPGETVATIDLAPGDYIAKAQAVDSAGSPIGSSVSESFTIAPTTVTVQIPVSITGV